MSTLALATPKLVKLIPLLGSDKPGEVIATLTGIDAPHNAQASTTRDAVWVTGTGGVVAMDATDLFPTEAAPAGDERSRRFQVQLAQSRRNDHGRPWLSAEHAGRAGQAPGHGRASYSEIS